MNNVEPDIVKDISRFIGVPQENLPSKDELLVDAIASEGVRLSLFQSPDSRLGLTPIHISQVKDWAVRKSRTFLDNFGVEPITKISEVIDSNDGPNMSFIGDIIRLSKGYIIPSMPKYVSIGSDRLLLVSGFPTFAFFEKGMHIFVNGIGRVIHTTTSKELIRQSLFELRRNDYLDKSDFEMEPKEFLEFLLSTFDREKWKPNKYEEAYLGITGGYGFSFGNNPLKVSVDEGILSFWKTRFDNNTIYRLKLDTRNSSEFSIQIPNTYFKRVCLALDSFFKNRRVAIINQDQNEVTVSLGFKPPDAEMRLIYALGGFQKSETQWKSSWTFPSEFLDEIMQIPKDLWLELRCD